MLMISHGEVPVARRVQAADLNSEHYSGQLVKVSGELVAGADKQSRVLRDHSGEVALFVPSALERDLNFVERLLVGGQVEIVGIASQRKDDPPFNSGYNLIARDTLDFQFTPIPPYRTIALTAVILCLGLGFIWERQRSGNELGAHAN
jgi:hypothetical protein